MLKDPAVKKSTVMECQCRRVCELLRSHQETFIGLHLDFSISNSYVSPYRKDNSVIVLMLTGIFSFCFQCLIYGS